MKRFLVILILCAICSVRAEEAVSSVFTFDSRVPASGEPVEAWAGREAVGLSQPFLINTRVVYPGGQPTISNVFSIARVSNMFVCDTGGFAADADGDGLPDWWEARYSQSKTGLLAGEDSDGDGMSARDEYIAYSNPTNAVSIFAISIEPRQNGLAICWPTTKARVYRLLGAESLTEGWDDEPIAVVEGTGEVASIPVVQGSAVRFFRVTVDLLPRE